VCQVQVGCRVDQVPRILPYVLPFLSTKTMWLGCHQNHCPLGTQPHSFLGVRSHAIVSLPAISGNQLSQLTCHQVRCLFIQHSHIPMGRSHPSISGICSHTVCFGGCVCLSAQPPIIFGNTLPHIMVSHILGSASF